jgi:hypothetical protein
VSGVGPGERGGAGRAGWGRASGPGRVSGVGRVSGWGCGWGWGGGRLGLLGEVWEGLEAGYQVRHAGFEHREDAGELGVAAVVGVGDLGAS